MDISVISGISILPYLAFIGLGLLVLEFFIPTKGLIGIVGSAFFILGTIALTSSPNADIRISVEACILLNVLVLGTAGVLLYLTYRNYRVRNEDSFSLQGKIGKVIDWNESTKRIELDGAIWAAKSISNVTFQSGQSVRVTGQQNLTLLIEPAGGDL